jgi:hypothetical protein
MEYRHGTQVNIGHMQAFQNEIRFGRLFSLGGRNGHSGWRKTGGDPVFMPWGQLFLRLNRGTSGNPVLPRVLLGKGVSNLLHQGSTQAHG